MTFIERYNDILLTKKQVEEIVSDCTIENNYIKDVRILVTGHFGNAVSVNLLCEGVSPFPLWNSTRNIGYVIRALIEFFDKENDNSINMSTLNGTPIRLVFENNCKCVALGHYTKDRFVLIEDLLKIQK